MASSIPEAMLFTENSHGSRVKQLNFYWSFYTATLFANGPPTGGCRLFVVGPAHSRMGRPLRECDLFAGGPEHVLYEEEKEKFVILVVSNSVPPMVSVSRCKPM